MQSTWCCSLESYTNLEAIPNAVISASLRPLINVKGFFLVTAKNMVGSTMRVWMSNPTVTVTTNMPSFCMESQTSSISAKRAAIKLHTPIGEYLESKGCLKAGLLVQFFVQFLFQFSMKFLSRVSSCDKTVAAIWQRFQTCSL